MPDPAPKNRFYWQECERILEARVGIGLRWPDCRDRIAPFYRALQHFCATLVHYFSPWFVSHF